METDHQNSTRRCKSDQVDITYNSKLVFVTLGNLFQSSICFTPTQWLRKLLCNPLTFIQLFCKLAILLVRLLYGLHKELYVRDLVRHHKYSNMDPSVFFLLSIILDPTWREWVPLSLLHYWGSEKINAFKCVLPGWRWYVHPAFLTS